MVVAAMVELYGVKKVDIKEYGPLMLKVAKGTNTDCKKGAYDYYKGVCKWMGDAFVLG